jgi:fructose-bisphosphate aldolase class II
MAQVNLRDMLDHAYQNNYAIGAFDIVSLDFLEAVIDAAEHSRAPVILSLAEPHFIHYDFELMLPAVIAAAKRATVPVSVQIDNCQHLDLAIKAINLGCNGIVLDASINTLPDNIKKTRAFVELANQCGVSVIGELGHAAKEADEPDQSDDITILTVPSEAKFYAERTGINGLSVNVGTAQGRTKGRVKIDFKRLKEIAHVVDLPLTLPGGTGLSEDQSRRLSLLGIAQINYYTALSDLAAETMRAQVKQFPHGSIMEYKAGVKQVVRDEVERCLRLWGSAGRAAEVHARCQPWTPIIKLVLHDVATITEHQAQAMMAEGKNVFVNLPGVLDVFTGKINKEKGKYRFCWIVQFCHQTALESFAEHPDYKAFINTLFNRVVSNELSIDFENSQNSSTDNELGEPEQLRQLI